MPTMYIYAEICGFLKDKFESIIERFEIKMEPGKLEDIITIKIKKQ